MQHRECRYFNYPHKWSCDKNFAGRKDCDYCGDRFEDHKSGTIRFYNRGSRYYEFTNFYEQDFIVGGYIIKSSEHLFQAMKFFLAGQWTHGWNVLSSVNPRDALDYASKHKHLWTGAWHSEHPSFRVPIKNLVMLFCCFHKFHSNQNLRTMLVNTLNTELIEDADRDNYWGRGSDWTGENHLGRILMIIRTHFQSMSQY
jgi:ribA/ribD-fused uncharacterized protein